MQETHWLATVLLTALLTSATLAADYKCSGGSDEVRCGLREGHRCISNGLECDRKLDCKGGSDEYPCGYMPGFVYVYNYTGNVFFPHKDTNMSINTTIKLMKINGDFIMKFEDPVLSQDAKDSANFLTDDEIESWKKEVKFQFTDTGDIGNIYYDSSHPQDILNMKKAIISMFQIKLETDKYFMTHTYNTVETDVTGKCRVSYQSKREVVPHVGNAKKLYKFKVTRINHYTDCENRPRDLDQNMESIKCDEQHGHNILKSRMRTSCSLYLHEDRMSQHAVITSCESLETQKFSFKSKLKPSLITVTVRKHLTLVKMMVSESHRTPKTWSSTGSILFTLDGLNLKNESPQQVLNQVKATLDRLHELVNEETKAWDLISPEAPSLYSKLIGQLKWKVNDSMFRDIYQQYYNQDKYRPWLESALPFVGSEAAGEEIKDKIESGSISGMSAVKLLTRLGMVNRPAKGLCENIMNLCQASLVVDNAAVHSSCWLAFGSLVHSYCKEKETCPDMFIQAMKTEYDAHLHTQKHHMEVIKNNEKLVVALKTIGNSGQKELLPQLMNIITTWDDHNAIMIAAIEATRRMVLDDAHQRKVQKGLRDIFKNRKMCPEIRIVAFQELIETGPTRNDILMPLANTMRAEINPLMKQFVYTYLDTESKVNCTAKKSRKAAINLLARTARLPRPTLIEFGFSLPFNVSTESKSFFPPLLLPLGIQNMVNVGSLHEGIFIVESVFSGTPRYIKLKDFMSLLEQKARQREIIPLLRKLFGPYGIMEEKTSLWDIIRGKRSADDDTDDTDKNNDNDNVMDDGFMENVERFKKTINPLLRKLLSPYGIMVKRMEFMRENISKYDDGFLEDYKRMKETLDSSTRSELPFKATLSSKMFGSEIAYLVLNDSHTFIQNLMKDGTIRVDKDWWSNSLNAGFKFNISANDIFFDAMRKIPTSIGIPLKIKTNTASIFAYGFYLNAKTSPMLNLLSFSNKPTEISANCRSCYSLSTYSRTKAYVFYRDFKLGYVVHQNMSLRCPERIKKLTLNGQPARQKYTIGFVMKKKKYMFYNSSSTFHRFVKLGDKYQMYLGSQIPGLGQPPGGSRWHKPNNRTIEEVQIKYQNITKEGDKESKFLLEFHVNGENDTKIAEYHMELNTTKRPENKPLMWDPSDGLADSLGGFSAKGYQMKQGEITYMACIKSGVDVPSVRWDIGVGWGKTCKQYGFKMSTVLNYQDGNPNINVSIKWEHLPVMFEEMMCEMREEMEKLRKHLMGSNAGMGQARPGGGGGAGGMGFDNPSNTSCFKSLYFSLSLKKSSTMVLSGPLLPKSVKFNYTLSFNGADLFEKTRDAMLYGTVTETCKVVDSNEITTFDNHSYTYDQSKGCLHVLAKDCSKKDLFTVFMKKDSSNQKVYTLVIKDKKNKGHVFVIDGTTVSYNGRVVQVKESSNIEENCFLKDLKKLKPNFSVCNVIKTTYSLVIKCKAGVFLEARDRNLKIKVTPWYFSYMCGMCGNFNWLPYDDFRAPQGFKKEANNETFGTTWLVPGKTCSSECKLLQSPDIQRPTGKLCVSRRPVTRCAENCQPTRQASAKRTYHCVDNGTDEANKLEQKITDKKFDEILKHCSGKDKNMEAQAEVHVDCQCTCPDTP